MKEFFKKLATMFFDVDGKVSFKRVTGGISFVAAVVFAALKYESEIFWPFLIYAASAIGFSLGEKKAVTGDEK